MFPPTPPPERKHIVEGTIRIRVRYVECDPMGFLHHSAYLPYFEMGRTELLRQTGYVYKDLEAAGFLFVVARIQVNYKKPARYDDELDLTTRLTRVTAVRLEHEYELKHAVTGLMLCTASTTLACVGLDGEIRAIPDELLKPRGTPA